MTHGTNTCVVATGREHIRGANVMVRSVDKPTDAIKNKSGPKTLDSFEFLASTGTTHSGYAMSTSTMSCSELAMQLLSNLELGAARCCLYSEGATLTISKKVG